MSRAKLVLLLHDGLGIYFTKTVDSQSKYFLSLLQKAIIHSFFKTAFTAQFKEQNVAIIHREAT